MRSTSSWLAAALAAALVVGVTPAGARAATAAPTSEARAINNAGEVAGWSTDSSGAKHAVFWPYVIGSGNGAAQDLGTLGGTFSQANGVNDLGEVVGVSADAGGAWRAFRWSATEGGPITELPGLPGALGCEADDVNDPGQIVGTCNVPAGVSGYTRRPVMWSGGQVVDLDPENPSVNGDARGVNDRGEVYGTSGEELVVWRGGRKLTLGGTSTSSFGDLNDRGEAVGNWANSGSGVARLFTPAAGGGYQESSLGTLPGGQTTSAYDINERGEVVGIGTTADATRGFRWDRGEMTVLNTLGGPNSYAYGINDRGEVVGQSHLSTLELHASVWSGGTVTDLGTL